MMNWLLVALLVVALVGIGALAMVIDSGVSDKHKQSMVYALFGLFGLIGVVFLLVEDKSAFIYGQWETTGKKGGKKSKQHGEVTDGDDGQGVAEAEVTRKAGGSGGDDGSGGGSGKGNSRDPQKKSEFASSGGRDCDVCPPMVALNGGKAVVGTLFHAAGAAGPKLGPLQEKSLNAFAISRYEITVAQFDAFVKAKGYKPANVCRAGQQMLQGATYKEPGIEQAEDHPVVCISWHDASAYSNWLTEKTGRRYALPSEIEWEHAARAGSFELYQTGKQIHGAQAQFRTVGDPRKSTVAVGGFSANNFGLHDVHGNAAEFVKNCWNESENAVAASVGECSLRMIKGGAWYQTGPHLQFPARAPIGILDADQGVGFRVVRYRE